jgi:hypothetical protein
MKAVDRFEVDWNVPSSVVGAEWRVRVGLRGRAPLAGTAAAAAGMCADGRQRHAFSPDLDCSLPFRIQKVQKTKTLTPKTTPTPFYFTRHAQGYQVATSHLFRTDGTL